MAERSSAGRISEVSGYCECDVASTYRVWLVHELFRGRLSRAEFEASEDNFLGFVQERIESKPHLVHVSGLKRPPETQQVLRTEPTLEP
jgi:hypothetical protein